MSGLNLLSAKLETLTLAFEIFLLPFIWRQTLPNTSKLWSRCAFTSLLSCAIFFSSFSDFKISGPGNNVLNFEPQEVSRIQLKFHALWIIHMTCGFGKQNDIIKCKCDVVMTADLGNLQSVPESLAITKLSRITCRISLEKRKDNIRSCGNRGKYMLV